MFGPFSKLSGTVGRRLGSFFAAGAAALLLAVGRSNAEALWPFNLLTSAAASAPWTGHLPNLIAFNAALSAGDEIQSTRELFKTLALMAEAESGQQNPMAPIEAAFAAAPFPPAEAARIETCLRQNWDIAKGLGVLTAENLKRMAIGAVPLNAPPPLVGAPLVVRMQKVNGGPERICLIVPQPHGPSEAAYAAAPRADPRVPAASAAMLAPRLDYVTISVGAPLDLRPYGGGTQMLFINAADPKTGVKYSIADPAQMKIQQEWIPDRQKYVATKIPYVHHGYAPWRETTLPGTQEKWVLVTQLNGAAFYVTTFGASLNTFRVAISASPYPSLPAGLRR